ncbi:MAG: hypothetical protein Q7R80_02320 [bacterium]|nr:hypothetical protein [bacterium]
MAERQPLFDKPRDELREAFVRARFMQKDVFGRPDIEAWLEGQRTASTPDRSMWGAFVRHPEWFERHGLAAPPTHLLLVRALGAFPSIHTESIMSSMQGRHGMDGCRCSARMMDFIRGCCASVIAVIDETLVMICGGEALIVSPPDHTNAHDPDDMPLRVSSTVTTTHVLKVFIERWAQQDGERATYARDFVCSAFGMRVAQIRGAAGLDFDLAVAVSADGTKIVHADWVAVVPTALPHPRSQSWVPRCKMTVFPGAAFRGRKILKSTEKMRLSPHYDPDSSIISNAEDVGRAAARQFDIVMRSPESSQAFGYLDKGGEGGRGFRDSCLITTASFCPSPLPDGGVEVTV